MLDSAKGAGKRICDHRVHYKVTRLHVDNNGTIDCGETAEPNRSVRPSDGFGRLGPCRRPHRERNDGAGPLIHGDLPTGGLSTDCRPDFRMNGHHHRRNFNRRDAVWHRRLGGDHPAQQEDLGPCRNSTSSFAPTPRMRAAQPIRAQSIKRVNANFAKKALISFVSSGEYKIVVKPREGQLVGKVMMPELVQAKASATKVKSEEIQKDTVCPNVAQNIIVISTPEQARVSQYASV
ncbi:hypothetical protein HPB51_015474 [Rhipicephalus microplus]|uniref:Uncharacterized protein n=1 Tax=Rhipicephalus microplus TaxID=6941 RepID=A0A9J6EH32_RHIMP|nr:hypothetical protein HPB51_015474 [Rhipicephalus microplus]